MSDYPILFSIIIPTRNRPTEFKAALDSVLGQSCTSLEVIVVNDGTSARYRGKYDEFENEYPDVKFINLIERSRGHGHCYARNQGVDASRGQYVGFLDDDDYWSDSEFLLRAEKQLSTHDFDYYVANQQARTHNGTIVENVWIEDLSSNLPNTDKRKQSEVFEVSVQEILNASGFPHQNVSLIRKNLYNTIGGMDENLRYEPDRDIFLRVADNADCIIHDRNSVAIHNIPNPKLKSNASTQTNRLEKLLFQLRTVDKALLFSRKKEILNFCTTRKSYLLKHITSELQLNDKNLLAFSYAKQALCTSFNLKWLAFTIYCWFKKLGDNNNALNQRNQNHS